MLKNRLKELRSQKGFSQKKLAELLDITQQAVAKWETGVTEPDNKTLISLADIFECSIDFLLGRKDISTKTITLAAHRTDSYGNPLTEDEQQVVNNVIEAYRKSKQANKEEK